MGRAGGRRDFVSAAMEAGSRRRAAAAPIPAASSPSRRAAGASTGASPSLSGGPRKRFVAMSSSNLGEPSPSKSPSKSPMMSSPVAESIGAVASASASDRAAASALGALAALSPRRLHTPPAPPSPVSACRLSESSARSGASDATDATDATLPTISAARALAPSPPARVDWQAVLSEQPPWEAAMYMLLHARARCWREVAELHAATQRANETRATRGAPAAPPPPPMMGALPKGWFPDAELGLGATRPEMSAEAAGLINEVLAVLRQPARLRDACPALGVWRPADVPAEASSVFRMMHEQLSTGKHRIRKATGKMVACKKVGVLRWVYFQQQVEALLAEPLLMLAAYRAMRAPATEPAPRPGRPPAAPPTPGEALLRCATACDMVVCLAHRGGNDEYDKCCRCATSAEAAEAQTEEAEARLRTEERNEYE
jgi:hypothetical protein